MLRLGILISGRGSNLQALIDACAAPGFPAQIATVIASRPDAAGLARAQQAGIPAVMLNHKDYQGREAFEAAMDAALRAAKVDLVCLAGFMRILTPWFVQQWHDRIINIHPSLLPAFPGTNMHERVIEAGVRFTGCTVHYVRPDVDTGPIIIQSVVPVLPHDTTDTLAGRVLQAEHKAYPCAVRLIAENRVKLDGPRALVDAPAAPETPLFNPRPE